VGVREREAEERYAHAVHTHSLSLHTNKHTLSIFTQTNTHTLSLPFLILTMTQVVGDGTGVKPLYDSIMQLKGLPFLRPQPEGFVRHVTAREVCSGPPVTLCRVEKVSIPFVSPLGDGGVRACRTNVRGCGCPMPVLLALFLLPLHARHPPHPPPQVSSLLHVLSSCSHNAFPVIQVGHECGQERIVGLVLRQHILHLLATKRALQREPQVCEREREGVCVCVCARVRMRLCAERKEALPPPLPPS
jgi:hypothetical protein